MTTYITLGDAISAIKLNGWYERDMGALDAALARPQASMYGVELYPGPHAKAAALMDSINRLHPLVDGNKRLSWLLVDAFYTLNGLALQAGFDDAETFVLQVADSHLEIEAIATWFANHTTRTSA